MAQTSQRTNGNGAPAAQASKDELLAFYRDMLLIRRFEERAGQLYGMGLIGGFCHLYIGQEAVACGLISVLEKGDTVVDSYRDHGHFIACGGGIAVEAMPLDRMNTEEGVQLKDIAHEPARYVNAAELRRMLGARIPYNGPDEVEDRPDRPRPRRPGGRDSRPGRKPESRPK